MPAPNIAFLYDFESPYEDALQAYFANINVGGQTFAQVVTPRSNQWTEEYQVTPRLQIRASVIGLGADGSGVKQDFIVAGNVMTNYYSYYKMGVTLDVVSQRSNNLQNHGILRGATRQGMLEITATLNSNSVPYYQTPFVNPGASLQSIDSANDEIITQLAYELDVFIPPSSFPNS